MNPRELIGNIILGQHNLCNSGKVFGLLVLHPQKLRGSEPGKGNIGRIFRQLLLTDHSVEILRLLHGPAVVPQNGRTNHPILLIQNDQPVHLPPKADPGHLALIHIPDQLTDSLHSLFIPVLRLLLGPTRMREIKRILPGNHVYDLPFAVHQQQLYGRRSQIHTYVQHLQPPLFFRLMTCSA